MVGEMMKLAWQRVAAWRMRRHHLVDHAASDGMLAVASRLCGLHAQVMSCAELTLWARIKHLERGAVQRALWEDRTLIKTWAMRGTLHLLPASELTLWHAALRTSKRYRTPAFWRRCFGITLEDVDRLTEAIGTALDGRVMTREELASEVGRLTGSAAFATGLAQGGWGTILKPAAFAGHLCFAPSLGQRVRFTRPDSWLASAAQVDLRSPEVEKRSRSAGRKHAAVQKAGRAAPQSPHRERPAAKAHPGPARPGAVGPVIDSHAATHAITRRFLGAYGPATLKDLARWWGGASVATARQWIASLGEELCEVDLDGRPAWMLASDAREARELPATRVARLIPAFDQYTIGASLHAEYLLPGVPRSLIYRPQGWVSPVLLVNGMMHGTWHHEVQDNRVEVIIEPFVKAPVWVRRAASQEAERLAAFFGRSLKLAWKS
jgi:hypothetical protein